MIADYWESVQDANLTAQNNKSVQQRNLKQQQQTKTLKNYLTPNTYYKNELIY